VTMIVMRVIMSSRRMGVGTMRIIVMLDGISARIAGVRAEYRDQPRENGAQQRHKDNCLIHLRA
jgi:hypothetical protein